jgi:hypothetical protein
VYNAPIFLFMLVTVAWSTSARTKHNNILMVAPWRQRRERLALLLHISPTSSIEEDSVARAIDESSSVQRDPGWSFRI